MYPSVLDGSSNTHKIYIKIVICCFITSSLISISIVSLTGSSNMTNQAPSRQKLGFIHDKLIKYESHVRFLSICEEEGIVPRGMKMKFGVDALPKNEYLHKNVDDIIHRASLDAMHTCLHTYRSLVTEQCQTLHEHMYNIQQNHDYYEFEAIVIDLKRKSKRLANKLWAKKKKKLESLRQKLNDEENRSRSTHNTQRKRKCRRFKRHKANLKEKNPVDNEHLVINLSHTALTEYQTKVLSLGPKFVPTPMTFNQKQLEDDIKEGCRLVRLRELHFNEEAENTNHPSPPPRFYKKNFYDPGKGRDAALDNYCQSLTLKASTHQCHKRPRDNLKVEERKALNQLREKVLNREIRISTADKGGAVVIQDVEDYIKEADRQLNNTLHYSKVDKDPTVKVAKQTNELLNKLHDNDHIDDQTFKWALLEPNKTRTQRFYHLPKIHKTLNKPPGRPIVSGVEGPTVKISQLVDFWLQDLVTGLPSYIQDSTAMLRMIEDLNVRKNPFGPETLLVTIDVVGLYTNIPHKDMLEAINFFLMLHHPEKTPPTSIIIDVVSHILRNNYFQFEGHMYKQEHGTAMGTPMAPTIANLFMGWLEKRMLEESPVHINDNMWKRYIDDIFLLWQASQEELETFCKHINSFHQTIKFTVQSSSKSIPFLDILIQLEDSFIITELFTKPTDTHAYLHQRSCHPHHCKSNIPYSQFLRLRRLCSKIEDFDKHAAIIMSAFLSRGYRQEQLQQALTKARNLPRTDVLKYKTREINSRVPFVITHHPSNPPLRKWLKEHQPMLHTSARMKKAMPVTPVVGERNPKSIRNIAMPSTLPQVISTKDQAGVKKCTGTCVVCREHLVETKHFSSDNTGEVFTVRHSLTCASENIIYLLFCSQCQGAQYVGETRNPLKKRFYLHRSHIQQNVGTHVTRHFNRDGHSLQDMKCLPIEQVLSNSHSVRHSREQFWIRKLKTMYPQGLNTL